MRTTSATSVRSFQSLLTLLRLAFGQLVVAALASALAYVVLAVIAPPDLVLAVPAAAGRVALDVPLEVVAAGIGTLDHLSLTETVLDRDGRAVAERQVPIALEGRHAGPFRQRFAGSIRAAAGGTPLHRDARYRLTAAATLWTFDLPFPKRVAQRQVVEFSTPRLPQPIPAADGRELHYGEPVPITWNLPMAHVELAVDPPTQLASWIDPKDPTTSYVALPKAIDGRPYTVRIERARSVDGDDLVVPTAFTLIAPARPQAAVPGQTIPIRHGQRVPIVWSVPVRSFVVAVDPTATADVAVDEGDRRWSTIGFADLLQGQVYAIEVSAVDAENGAPAAAPLRFRVATPPALEIARVEPADGAEDQATESPAVLTFGEAVSDRAAAEAAIQVEPAVPGHFEWPADNQVRFVPEQRWPSRSQITVRIAGGPDGPRGVGGGYLPEPLVFGFTTALKKVIDVDLTRQWLVLLEDDRPVFESPAATGVPGGETPPGTFFVQYKMATAHFRGINPDGSAYDIPNVPWVLPFMGDYTIHGAPWRRRFGTPGSAGCVSLPADAARTVYDWASVGTPIIIHR